MDYITFRAGVQPSVQLWIFHPPTPLLGGGIEIWKFCGFRICSRSFFRAGSISRGSWRPRIGRNPHSWLFLAPPIPIWVSLGPVTSLILANCPSGRFGAFSEQFSALQSSINSRPPASQMPSLNLHKQQHHSNWKRGCPFQVFDFCTSSFKHDTSHNNM